jgi:purine-nucleoside phosphorylase
MLGNLSEMAASLAGAPFAVAEKAARYLVRALPKPEVAVVLGSGWGAAAEALGPAEAEMPMAYLPGFVAPTVGGHAGVVSSVRAGGRAVLLFLGRSHLYEGRTPSEVVHAVRTAVMAGARTVVLTSAAGSLRTELRPGQVVVVRDHINLTGASPLSGDEPPAPYGPRFVDLSDLYCARLREAARRAGRDLPEGVYAALPGPHYETPAEIAMLRAAGADLVGMSTALEAIAARHLGAEVFALSLVTNLAAGVSPQPLGHAEVLAAGDRAAPRLGRLLAELLPLL